MFSLYLFRKTLLDFIENMASNFLYPVTQHQLVKISSQVLKKYSYKIQTLLLLLILTECKFLMVFQQIALFIDLTCFLELSEFLDEACALRA